MQPITRREFFRTLVPSWFTWKVIGLTLAVGAGTYIAINLWQVVQKQGIVASAKGAGFLAGICAAVFLLSQLTLVAQRAVAAAPEDFRSFVQKLTRLLELAVAIWIGAVLHARWLAGEDILPTIVVLAGGFLVFLFRDGKKG